MTDQNKTHGVLSPWMCAEQLARVPAVDEALQVFANDASYDNATGIIVAVLANAAPQSPVVPASVKLVEKARDALRAEQAAAVMPLIGPMLDAWERVPNDEKGHLRIIGIGEHLDSVNRAMVSDQPVAPVDDKDAAELIVRDVCELDPANPDLNETVCVDVSDLLIIAKRHTADRARLADAPTASSAEFALQALVAAGFVSADKVREARAIFASLPDAPTVSATAHQHPDDDAVDRFAEALKEKLAQARKKGRSGWHECDPRDLSRMLREHVEKGDPRDVANFCMFLWSLGQPISPVLGWADHIESLRRISDRVSNAAPTPPTSAADAERVGWQPVATAPKNGKTLLLGYYSRAGKWRTVRGQWMSEAYIAENWEEPDNGEPGWFETAVEADDAPNCWAIDPTHWMPLPAAPTQERGADDTPSPITFRPSYSVSSSFDRGEHQLQERQIALAERMGVKADLYRVDMGVLGEIYVKPEVASERFKQLKRDRAPVKAVYPMYQGAALPNEVSAITRAGAIQPC